MDVMFVIVLVVELFEVFLLGCIFVYRLVVCFLLIRFIVFLGMFWFFRKVLVVGERILIMVLLIVRILYWDWDISRFWELVLGVVKRL